jgi:hypothetical protein
MLKLRAAVDLGLISLAHHSKRAVIVHTLRTRQQEIDVLLVTDW